MEAWQGRLGHSVVAVPERGDAETVRLIRQAPAQGGRVMEAVKKVTVETKAAKVVQPKRPAAAPVPKATEGRTVVGQVLDSQGKPLGGVSVYMDSTRLRGALRNRGFESVTTDRDGVFMMPGLPREEVPIVLRHPSADGSNSTLSKTLPA